MHETYSFSVQQLTTVGSLHLYSEQRAHVQVVYNGHVHYRGPVRGLVKILGPLLGLCEDLRMALTSGS